MRQRRDDMLKELRKTNLKVNTLIKEIIYSVNNTKKKPNKKKPSNNAG
ncbi:hypothetical protein [Cytobacillus gottheilii]|nr:hypothetical protein [Cytobacillus gottheilii]